VQHFTYSKLNRDSLCQGDVLRRTPAIDEILRKVHPHYHQKADYRYLMVLTQSCDLVRRYGKGSDARCGARYISIAAVRPMEVVLSREIARLQRNPIESKHRLCDAAHRDKVKQFVERLLNNNEEEYFYLHPSQDADGPMVLDQPHCAFLALSIAIKSELHYQTCLDAKVLQLDESFQHKLGWLVGKMYSRVGTVDWVPKAKTEEEFEGLVRSIVEGACVWIDPSAKAKLLKRIKELPEADRTTDRILEEYKLIKDKAPKKKELVADRLVAILQEQELDAQLIRRIKNLFTSDPDISDNIPK
jgi:hypothetical protein